MKRYSICFEWRYRQGVKSPPFHGGITGSNPVAATNYFNFNSLFASIAQLVVAPHL